MTALEHANRPWDGRTWFVDRPADYVSGLYRLDQLQARDILKSAQGLTNWEAELCQRTLYRDQPSSPVVRFWLDKIEREKCGRVAA